MIDTLQHMLSFGFIQRAILVGVLTGIMSALIGVNLVLKNFSMIGDGLSHVGFGAFTIAVAIGVSPLGFAAPVVIIAAFLMLKLGKKGGISGDAKIALLSSSALAIGVVVTSLRQGMNTDIFQFMFGSILASGKNEVLLSIIMSLVVIIAYTLLYHPMFAITFDENFSKAVNLKVEFYRLVLAVLTAVVIVVGMRIMGAMLISALILFPALSALKLFRSFRACLISSGIIAAITVLIGIFMSYFYSLPTGAVIVLVNLGFFLLVNAITFILKK